MSVMPLDVLIGVVLMWIALGMCALLLRGLPRLITNLIFPLGALVALVLAAQGYAALGAAPQSVVLPLGLPGLPMHLRLDSLSAF
ncbi:MAG: hydrogenase 4 subunit B, partial [Gallionella sp.]